MFDSIVIINYENKIIGIIIQDKSNEIVFVPCFPSKYDDDSIELKFIDDEKNYCVALFEDEGLDAAIGRNGMNINLASKLTDYKIDAYGVNQYERIQEDQKTSISENSDFEIFNLSDSILSDDVDMSLKIFKKLQNKKTAEPIILWFLFREMERLILTKEDPSSYFPGPRTYSDNLRRKSSKLTREC